MVLKLVAGQLHDSLVRCDSSQEEGQDNTCTILIHRGNSIGFLSGFTAVHPVTLVDDDTILRHFIGHSQWWSKYGIWMA